MWESPLVLTPCSSTWAGSTGRRCTRTFWPTGSRCILGQTTTGRETASIATNRCTSWRRQRPRCHSWKEKICHEFLLLYCNHQLTSPKEHCDTPERRASLVILTAITLQRKEINSFQFGSTARPLSILTSFCPQVSRICLGVNYKQERREKNILRLMEQRFGESVPLGTLFRGGAGQFVGKRKKRGQLVDPPSPNEEMCRASALRFLTVVH